MEEVQQNVSIRFGGLAWLNQAIKDYQGGLFGHYGYIVLEGQQELILTVEQGVRRMQQLERHVVVPEGVIFDTRYTLCANRFLHDAVAFRAAMMALDVPASFDPLFSFRRCTVCGDDAAHGDLTFDRTSIDRFMTITDAVEWVVHQSLRHGLDRDEGVSVLQRVIRAGLPFDVSMRDPLHAAELHGEYVPPEHLTCPLPR